MNQGVLESLFARGGFTNENFPDLFYPILIASLVLFIGSIVLYNVQVRRLHRHPPLVNLQEWLLWTGLATITGLNDEPHSAGRASLRPGGQLRLREKR